MSSLPVEMTQVVDFSVNDDIDGDIESKPKNPALPSYHVLCLQDTVFCPSFLWKCLQIFEEIRWKLTTFKFLSYGVCPFKSGSCKSIPIITISDILIFICFVTFELILFNKELQQRGGLGLDTADSMRIFALICGRQSVVIYGITWTLATRNSLWYLIIGIPFERALFYHIWFGRYAVFLISIHFILMLYYFNATDAIIDNLLTSSNISGLIAIICVILIFIFSLPYFRRNEWEFFLKSHWILFLSFFYFAIKHHAFFWNGTYWMKIGIFCWIFDVFYRIYISILKPLITCSKPKILNVQLLTDNIIKLTLQKNNFLSGVAQYCFICIPAISMTEWHPFSITSNTSNYIEFHIKVLGDWTNKLKELIIHCESSTMFHINEFSIFLEGPYGKTEYQLEKYNSIILIAGGIGITPICNIFHHLVQYLQNNNITQIRKIKFLWMIRNPQLQTMKEFNRIHWLSVKQIKNKNSFTQNIVINKTNIETNYFVTKCNDNTKINQLKSMYNEGIQFNRPNIDDIINEAKQYGNCGIFICGPLPMINTMKKNASKLSVDCHAEKFHF